jgi:hypothetical protein
MNRFVSALALLALPALALAHEGHGMEGVTHWHATDTWGFVITAAVVVATVAWFGRKK